MIEVSSPKKKRGFSRFSWCILHLVVSILWPILLLAVPMYEKKIGEKQYAFGFFFEATSGMPKAPEVVYYVLFGLILTILVSSIVLYAIAASFDKSGRIDRSDRYFVGGAITFIGGNALMCLLTISLSLVIPLVLSVVLASLGFGSLYVHAKKYAELAEL